MKWSDLSENWCPVARTLSLVGDRWTMLILRDCFLGMSRLKRLVEAGVLERKAYTNTPKRYDYVLTEKGQELAPALLTLRDWGKKHMPVRRATSA